MGLCVDIFFYEVYMSVLIVLGQLVLLGFLAHLIFKLIIHKRENPPRTKEKK